MANFELGTVVNTGGVNSMRCHDPNFNQFVRTAFDRYRKGNWGDICEEDKELNDAAVRDGEQIVALYKYSDEVSIYIITEWNRSATTICFTWER